jgi:pyruvate dehydrogenase E2 component (dihydrolipoamide acetyltransferase)
MSEAKATVPHFQVETEVVMDTAISLRARLKQLAGDEPAPSLNDLIVKAAALALRAHPKANGSYRDAVFELHDRVNIGIAVAADGALVVPTIVDADRRLRSSASVRPVTSSSATPPARSSTRR